MLIEEAEMIAVGTILVVMLVTVTMTYVLAEAAERPGRWAPLVSGVLGIASIAGWVWAIQAAGSAVVP